jgi:HK97 family phage major capsid protein
VDQLQRLRREVADLISAKDALDPGNQLYKAMVHQEASDARAYLAKPGAPMIDRRPSSGAGENLAELTFSNQQLADPQKGALNRIVTTKASISAATASMAGVAQYQLNPFPYLRDAGRILDLIPQERTNAPAVHYFAETTAPAAAAAVAEGAAKPESTPVRTEVTAKVRKLAHYTRVNDEVVANFDVFRQVIGNSMLAGPIATENAQLITGIGIAPNLLGLATNSSVLTVGSAGTDLDAIAAAFVAIRVGAAQCDPDVVVMHPNDWYSAGFLLAKETTGGYLVGSR